MSDNSHKFVIACFIAIVCFACFIGYEIGRRPAESREPDSDVSLDIDRRQDAEIMGLKEQIAKLKNRP